MDWKNPFDSWFDSAPKAPEPDAPPDPGFLTKSFASPWVSVPYALGSGLLAASAPNYGTGKLASGINAGLEFGMGAEKKAYDREKEKRLSDAFGKMMAPSHPSTVYAPDTSPGAGGPQTEAHLQDILKSIPNTPGPALTGKAGEYAKSIAAAGNPAEAMKFVGHMIGKDDNVQIVTLADGSKAYFDKATRTLTPIPGSGKLPSYRETLDANTKDKVNYDRELQGLPPIDTSLPLVMFAREAGFAPPAETTPATPATPTPAAAPARSFPNNVDVRPGSATTPDRKTISPVGGQPYNVPVGTTVAQLKIINDAMGGAPTATPAATPTPIPRVEAPKPSIDAKGRPRFNQPAQPTGATSRIYAEFLKEMDAKGIKDPKVRRDLWNQEQAAAAKTKAEGAAMGGIAAKNTPAARSGAANVAGGTAEGGAGPKLDAKKNELDLEKMPGMTLDAKTGEVVSITKGDYARSPKAYIPLTPTQERVKGGIDTAMTHVQVTSQFLSTLPQKGLRATNYLSQKISQLENDPDAVVLFQQLGAMTSLAAGSMLVAGGGGRPGVRLAEFMAPASVNEGDTLASAVKKMQSWSNIAAQNAEKNGIPGAPYKKARREMNVNIARALLKEAGGNKKEAEALAAKLGLTLNLE